MGDLVPATQTLPNNHIVVGASAKNGIKQLVYALAGYDPCGADVVRTPDLLAATC
jgi:hypothetical protein